MYITLSALFWLVKTVKRFDGNIVTFVNNWAWGMGHGALGIGHWALVIGHWSSLSPLSSLSSLSSLSPFPCPPLGISKNKKNPTLIYRMGKLEKSESLNLSFYLRQLVLGCWLCAGVGLTKLLCLNWVIRH